MTSDAERRRALERLRPYIERARWFSGWSFEELDVRHLQPGPPWDLVYLLCVAPWTIPEFDIEHDLDALLAVEAACATADGIVLTETGYLLVAERAGSTPW